MMDGDLFDWINRWVQAQRNWLPSVGTVDYELWARPGLYDMLVVLSYRAYARLINHSRRPRKISWKHLNRHQRERALELFLYQEAKNNG